MAMADSSGLSKLQQIGLALSYFGDAANQAQGQKSNFASGNLNSLKALQEQLLLNQQIAKKQGQDTALSEAVGGFDPKTGVTWDSGRQVSGIVSGDLPAQGPGMATPMQGPLPAGMAEANRPIVEGARPTAPGIAFDPKLRAENLAGINQSLIRAFPEEVGKAQISAAFRNPKDNFIASGGNIFDVSDPANVKQVGTSGKTDDLVNVIDREKPNEVPRGMSKMSAAALISRNPDRYALAGAASQSPQETWGNPVPEVGQDGRPIQVRYSNLGHREIVEGAIPAKQGNAFDRQDYWRGQFKPYLDSATNANVQASKVRSQLKLDTGTGQIAAINAVQKMIDEGAVVRDQDVALIQSAQSVVNRFKGQMEAIKTGRLLSPDLQNELQGVADSLEQATYAGAKARIEPYTDAMKVEGVTLDSIVPAGLRKSYGWEGKQVAPGNVSQADLEHTAKLYNMTVDQVKQKLGIQ